MRRLIIILLPLLVCFAACAGRDRRNVNCQAPQEPPFSLDLRNPEHRRHLSDEALRAEDIAVRYSDSDTWKVPGQPTGHDAYVRARRDCMATLFSEIAKNHGVSVEQVRESIPQGRMRFDVAVLLSFAAFYFLAAYYLANRVCRRFPLRESWLTALLCTVGASILVSLAGIFMLETFAFLAEIFRYETNHVSDRANRIPWPYIRIPLFAGGLILFWLAAALRYRAANHDAEVADYYCTLRLHH
jgi:hypothetical protein